MKRKLYIKLFTLVVLVACFKACEKPDEPKVSMSQPEIFINDNNPYEFEEIMIRVVEYAEKEGNRVKPTLFNWFIADSLGKIVDNDFEDTLIIYWTPQESGRYNVGVEIFYSEEDYMSTQKELFVYDSTDFYNSIIVNPPTIKIITDSLYLNEEIEIKVDEYALTPNERIMPISFNWSITDSSGLVIKEDFDNTDRITWTPQEIGEYYANVIVSYIGGITSSDSKDFLVVIEYRQRYSGDYHFMKVTTHWQEFQEDRVDTTYYEGYVIPILDDKNMVEIKSGEEQLLSQGYHEHFSTELFYKDGYEHPQFGRRSDHKYRYGFFVNRDSIVIRVAQGALGGGAYWNYYGSKIK